MNTELKIILTIMFFLYALFNLLGYIFTNNTLDNKLIEYKHSSKIHYQLAKLQMQGIWIGKENNQIMQSKSGKIDMNLNFLLPYGENVQNITNKTQFLTNRTWYFQSTLRDPLYSDEHMINILQEIEFRNNTITENEYIFDFKQDNLTWSKNFQTIESLQRQSQMYCNIQGNLTINSGLFNEDGFNPELINNKTQFIDAQFFSDQKNCTLNFQTKISYNQENDFYKIAFYSGICILVLSLNFIGASNILKKLENNFSQSYKLSLFCAEIAMVQDIYFMVFNLVIGTRVTTSYLLLFFQFLLFTIIFAVYDHRIIMYIWRYQLHRNNPNLNDHQLKNRIFFYQLKIWFYVILYTIIMYRYFLNPNFILVNSFVLIPQILHNLWYPSISEFDLNFNFLFTSSKYFIFLYFRGIPFLQIIDLRPNTIKVGFGLVIICVCIIFLFFQDQRGANFFLPKIILNKGHSFFYTIKQHKKLISNKELNDTVDSQNDSFFQEKICPICLTDLYQITYEMKENCKKINSRNSQRLVKANKDKVLVTPCKHSFHPICFFQWIEIKMECPCCRRGLPTIN